jgi:very-short-patch-repair endonuclease
MTANPKIIQARTLRREATPPERLLWGFLRTLRHEGCHFRRQAPFRGYVLDFVCYGQRLVIEVDGETHGAEAQHRHDTIRDAVLAREGFRTLRFLATDVMRNLEGVSIAIRANLATPHPIPPHKGEGEASDCGKATNRPHPCGEGWGGG